MIGRRVHRIAALLALALAALACSFPVQQAPTPTAALTPSPDGAAEATIAAAQTEVAALAATNDAARATFAALTVTPTSAPTRTPTATLTASPTLTHTPTPTAGPPPTRTPTPSADVSPTPSAVPDFRWIERFEADVDLADPGDAITLSWETSAGAVTLCRLLNTGQFGTCWEVEPDGSRVVDIAPEARNWVGYTLIVTVGDETEAMHLTVPLTCPDTWFFPNPPASCPMGPAERSQGAQQFFERGMMVWHAGRAMIFVLYAGTDQPAWRAAPDPWVEGMPVDDPSIVAPPGLFQPVRGFGMIWRGEGALVGVRDRVGWALAPEFPIETAFQCDSAPKYNTCYLQTRDGIIELKPEGSGWSSR
ncbi:MAG: hypothetical protein Kow00124_30700 [Anaerolineae bacterium]